jgi:hypothetical protein
MSGMVPKSCHAAGVSLLVAGLTNMILAIGFAFALLFLCVGVCWFVPLGFSLVEVITGIRLVTGRRVHSVIPIAVVGSMVSLVNFNPLSFALDVLALVLVLGPEARAWLEADERSSEIGW